MIHVYGIPNCNTVKKGIEWLKANKLEYTFHNYKKEGASVEKLQQWCSHFGWEKLVNKAGTTWKNLPDDVRAAVTEERSAIELMHEHNSVIKRPIIEAEGKYLVSFNEDEYREKLLEK